MRGLTHALAVLYGAAALLLAHSAVTAYGHGSSPYALLLAGCSGLFSVAVAHHTHQHLEARRLRVELEHAARPPLTTAQDTAVARLMTTPCCEAWWSAVGGPHHCTRKDQTT